MSDEQQAGSPRWVIWSDQLGVYLGALLGLAFWSKLDPMGQDRAPAYDSKADALAEIESWAQQVADAGAVAVWSAERYATMDEIQRAGLDGWAV